MPVTTVHFATNREEIHQGEAIVGFGRALNPISPLWLRYGAADMASAGRRKPPEFTLQELRVAPESIPGVTPGAPDQPLLGSALVFEGLRQRLVANKADLVLMLHGFACTFDNALANAAEIKTGWGSAKQPLETAIFSWPADGEITPFIKYASDRDDARSSAKAVARALMRFVEYVRTLPPEEWCGRQVHLVAHSMGNYMLRNALQAMLSDAGSRPLPRVFKNIFLMAADEDDDAFEDERKLKRLPELAEAVHVYFARNDRALTISDLTKGNPDRLGSTGPRTLTSLPHKVTLVDCQQVSSTDLTDAGHQYYRKRAEVIADVRQVLAGMTPEEVAGRDWIPSRRCFQIRAG
jgi:esterase/lipase superfamily enzyme